MSRSITTTGLSLLLCAGAAGWSQASSLGIYSFNNAAGNEVTFPVDVQPQNATFSDMSRGSGITASLASGAFSASGWSTATLDADDYFEFTLTPAGGFSLTLTNLSFAERRSSTGPRELAVRSSLDAYTANLATLSVPDDTATRTQTVPLGGGFSSQSGPVTFRLYAYAAESSNGTWRIDNVDLAGSIDSSGGSPTNVQFIATTGSVGESDGTFNIVMYKTAPGGNVSGQLALGGDASEGPGDDYTINSTNFILNGAATSVTFTVTLVDDAEAEALENAVFQIVNVVGGGVGSPDTFTLAISDDDVAPGGTLLISQYTEADSGTTPKGIEIWNNSGSPITFDDGANLLDIQLGVNGGPAVSVTTLERGTLAAGDVWVIGTANMNPNVDYAFLFNGNDAIVLELGGVVVDTFGLVGNDPGTATGWSSNGVQTANRNIQLKSDITTGDSNGWTDPSERFEDVGAGSLQTGFGIPPNGAPSTNIRFLVAADSIGEDAGVYVVTLWKTAPGGGVTGQVALSGTAVEGLGNDYTINTTNFVLNDATTTAEIVITVNDDSDDETAETVVLTLANVNGANIGMPFDFTLTLNDNDDPALDEYEIVGRTIAGSLLGFVVDISSNDVPYTLYYSTNLVTDPAPEGTGLVDTQLGDGGSITLQETNPVDRVRHYWIRTN